ncbi:MAG: flagellar hook-basal body complex protein FliE [Bacillota bacterium]
MPADNIGPATFTNGMTPGIGKPVSPIETRKSATASPSGESSTFAADLRDALNRLNDAELHADAATRALASGKTDDVLGATMASEKATLAMNLALKVRADALDAYDQIMRMSL